MKKIILSFVLALFPSLGAGQATEPGDVVDARNKGRLHGRAAVGPLRFARHTGRSNAQSNAGALHFVEPCRFLDSRDAETLWYEMPGPFEHGRSRFYVVQGSCSVPFGATGVILNVTATEATTPGHLLVWDYSMSSDSAASFLPKTSTLNFNPGTTSSNEVTVSLPEIPNALEYGDLMMHAHVPNGTVHLIVDIVGYLR